MNKQKNIPINQQRVSTQVGEVPIAYWLPENKNAPVIVAFHYQTGSKDIWFNSPFDKLFAHAVESQSALIACDIYGHGDWKVDNFDGADISDEMWDTFVEESGVGVTEAIKSILEQYQLTQDKLQFVGSSSGCLVALEVLKRGLTPTALVLSAPLPEKEYDDDTSFHNNLTRFKGIPLLVLTGTEDDEVPAGEVEWFFNLVDSPQKEFVEYESGHELPLKWLDKAIAFLKS